MREAASSEWEQAVIWLREQPDQAALTRACYYDDPVEEAARRFWRSPEWRATRDLLGPRSERVLDLGAGRGIASHAFAHEGCRVFALEPDGGSVVGVGAVQELERATGLRIRPTRGWGEDLPFRSQSFDLAYGRQVLHHASDLQALLREVCRVLRPGGRVLFAREHVVDGERELGEFLARHPLHWRYGGEHAYTLDEYLEAMESSGLTEIRRYGPLETPINYEPMSEEQWWRLCAEPLRARVGGRVAKKLTDRESVLGRMILGALARRASRLCSVPGRLYSFSGRLP